MKCSYWNTNNSDIDVIIDHYISGELSKEETTNFEAHLLDCDDCFQKLETRRQLVSVIEKQGEILFADFISLRNQKKNPPTTPRTFLKPLINITLRYRVVSGLVAAVILLFAVWAGYQSISNQIEQRGNFATSAYLEEMIITQHQLRGVNKLEIKTPEINQRFTENQPIFFRGEFSGNTPLTLKILDHRGSQLYQYLVKGSIFQFEEKLQRGLYYWKLETENEMRIGKFMVK